MTKWQRAQPFRARSDDMSSNASTTPPAVTVLLCVFNGEMHLREAVDSIRAATLRTYCDPTESGRFSFMPFNGAIIEAARISPDGTHLLVTTVHRPFSYLHAAREFPKEVEVWDRTGKMVRKIASSESS